MPHGSTNLDPFTVRVCGRDRVRADAATAASNERSGRRGVRLDDLARRAVSVVVALKDESPARIERGFHL